MNTKKTPDLRRAIRLPHATAMVVGTIIGADHLVAGSDYPHQIGSLEKMVESIEKLNISSEKKAGIFGQNAARLLRL